MKKNCLHLPLAAGVTALIDFSGKAAVKSAGLPAYPVSTPGPSTIGVCRCAITKSGNWVVT